MLTVGHDTHPAFKIFAFDGLNALVRATVGLEFRLGHLLLDPSCWSHKIVCDFFLPRSMNRVVFQRGDVEDKIEELLERKAVGNDTGKDRENDADLVVIKLDLGLLI